MSFPSRAPQTEKRRRTGGRRRFSALLELVWGRRRSFPVLVAVSTLYLSTGMSIPISFDRVMVPLGP